MTILERELSNSDLIYIYWEQDGKWYAYEQSAFYLSQMMLGVSLGALCHGGYFVAGKSRSGCKPDSHENIISYSKTEYVLHYTPHNGFHEWLAEIK